MKHKPTTFVNLTPHPVNIYTAHGDVIEIPTSGTVARLEEKRVKVGTIDGYIGIYRTEYGYPKNLPEPQENTVYIVSALLMNHPTVLDRQDVVAPGAAIRDESGHIIGADGFSIPTHRHIDYHARAAQRGKNLIHKEYNND